MQSIYSQCPETSHAYSDSIAEYALAEQETAMLYPVTAALAKAFNLHEMISHLKADKWEAC